MKFRSWHGPLHPELAEEMKKKKKEKELHPCIVTLTWQAGNQEQFNIAVENHHL